ncbi:pyridoxal phosphate-dependent decarboxylase family protein [Denitromonas halophila]|uniref:Aspartate aminotransferase family protein n=1 Tax=Denitromonas halophila TaxID=1629404 RepID=A0A557R2T0_9RHOO|nr:pyridoxal-dependent decarboxylase [Denitromonas halophila]TVO59465.1 aspartate aminotransferase family protein [Denitromonas halophila]
MSKLSDILSNDLAQTDALLREVCAQAKQILAQLPTLPVGGGSPPAAPIAHSGGARAALNEYLTRFSPGLAASAGPRYFGFVTGGATPAALVGDWLASVIDQNATGSADSNAGALELETLALFRDMLGLPDAFNGAFVSGATMANFVGLATGRQWLGVQAGVDVAEAGLAALGPVRVLSAGAHSSTVKSLAMLGLGRQSLHRVAALPGREAADVVALAEALAAAPGPCIVVANAGTVNTCDFDDLAAIAALKDRFDFWLHVDAAFAGIAAASDRYRPRLAGWEMADSITVDCHKWLNVPYDSAVALTRHLPLQAEVFRNHAAYLRGEVEPGNFLQLTPENSRRFRALPAWFTLRAYGQAGYAGIVERNCDQARWLGEQIAAEPRLRLLAPVMLNGFCFAPVEGDAAALLDRINATGEVFMTPTVLFGQSAIRGAISHWATTQADMERVWAAIQSVLPD